MDQIQEHPREKTIGESPQKHTPSEKESLIQAPKFVNIEANLAALGFFTPSNKRIFKKKTVKITKLIDGQKAEKWVTYIPTVEHGLPTAPADQDKYVALMKIINEIKKEKGTVTNPILITTAETLRLLGKYRDSGKNYKDFAEWLERMTGTLIISGRAVYFAGRKEYRSDTFHVFERVVTKGKKLDDGTTAEKHYIFLSDWQLNNLNHNHVLPIDWETYIELKHHIAKAFFFPLQILLYATQERGYFEKRYAEVCQLLGLPQYKYPSKIKEKLGPSLDEFRERGYLKRWQLEKTKDRKAYKICFWHGKKFYRDRRSRLKGKEQGSEVVQQAESVQPTNKTTQVEQGIEPPFLKRLTRWGISEKKARELLLTLPSEQPVEEQLEYAEHEIQRQGTGIENPAGFIIDRLRDNAPIPEHFVSTRQRLEIGKSIENQREAFEARVKAYEVYISELVNQHIEQNHLHDEYQTRLLGKIDRLRRIMPKKSDEDLAHFAGSSLYHEIAKEIPHRKSEREFFEEQPPVL